MLHLISSGSSNWSDQPQQQFSQQSQTQMALSSMNNGANNYVIPNISSSTNVFQVPASEMNNGSSTPVNASIPMTTSVTTSLSTLPSTTTSGPSIDEQRQNLKGIYFCLIHHHF